MPNAVAYLALFAWPVAVGALFARLPQPQAVIWSILAGYLLLPQHTSVDLPALPALDRTLMPSLAAAVMCMTARRPAGGGAGEGAGGWLPASPLISGLCLLYLLTPIGTSLLNADPVFVGAGVFLRGLSLYDAMSATLGRIVLLLPYLLARRHLGGADGPETLLRAYWAAGLAYSLPMLFEVRMSPQLHTWIYGFFPHSFAQAMRGDGFRPMVFLEHGLWVAIFACKAFLAALVLVRLAPPERRGTHILTAGWLFLALVACKSLGALALAILLAPAALLAPPRAQLLAAAGVAAVTLLYPALRGAGLVPLDAIYAAAEAIEAERAASFRFRLDNEDELLARANERPLFGWGGWGRPLIYDPTSGRTFSITDGRWIIVIGVSGWSGYIAEFGLLTLPVLLLAARRQPPSRAVAGLCLVLGANLVDLIPNATLTPLTWLIAGAVLAQAERAPAPAGNARARAAPAAGRRRPARPAPRPSRAVAWDAGRESDRSDGSRTGSVLLRGDAAGTSPEAVPPPAPSSPAGDRAIMGSSDPRRAPPRS